MLSASDKEEVNEEEGDSDKDDSEVAVSLIPPVWDNIFDPQSSILITTWVFNTKPPTLSALERKKACLCIQGFSQVLGIDYGENFETTGKFTSLVMLLIFSINKKLQIHYLVWGAKELCIMLQPSKANGIEGLEYYTDATSDNLNTQLSCSGSICFWKNCPITWNSKKQKNIKLSSTEAEMNSLVDGAQENQWIKFMAEDGTKNSNQQPSR
ncbi:hypothetical protein VP01_1796g9 [Puccinia sorghi]|uniref:Reverse transcriptase Ty1/copia-type domain-containing protein n=1 Tax=Puccinia sorghi TaxID=27349 RepID=A0A0L6VEF7_9BASI|nr:hypothetical protein VP01_1796g9 [Puccinia sorghi]